ncbi:hypothetical protein [Desemzia sp. FAM 23989]|uniref:hypothetical protein n=1 Tax=Desemzia sp. FAM 23989 TaxID=3259523 RepID=UPI003889F673
MKFNLFETFLKNLKLIMTIGPTALFIIMFGVLNWNWEYFLSTFSMVLGIIGYYISVFLIDSTNKIREELKQEQIKETILKVNSNKFMADYTKIEEQLNKFSTIVLDLKKQLETNGTIEKTLQNEYTKTKIIMIHYIEIYKDTIVNYSDGTLDIEFYISVVNKTKPDKITRNLSQTLKELQSETITLQNAIFAIPKLIQ